MLGTIKLGGAGCLALWISFFESMENFHEPQPPDSINTIEKAIQKLRYEKIEHLYIFKNGKQKRHFIGTEKEVIVESKYLIDVKDAVIVHNHPQGTSFSPEDFAALVNYDGEKLILVTLKYTYTVTRNRKWNIILDEQFDEIFNACSILAENLIDKEIAKNATNNFEKELEKMHYIWITIFDYYGISYKKNKI